jgi:PmbA protein
MSAHDNSVDQAIDHLLDKAKAQKLDLEVLAAQRSSTAISFNSRKMDQFSFSETRTIGVRLIHGKNEGVAYSESLDRDSLDNILDEARANAKMIHRDWISELHTSNQLPEMKELFNPALESVPMADKILQAEKLETAALAYDKRITNVAYARYGDGHQQMWIANSKGLRGSYKMNVCYAYAKCLAKDGENSVMAGEYETHHGFENLDGARVAEVAARKTLERMGADRPSTGRYTVVFENRVSETLIGMITDYFSAKSIDDKTSPLVGKLGQKIFSGQLTLTDDPFFKHGASSRPFDDEGYPSQKTVLVEEGKVNAFLTNSVLARKLKLAHTASADRAPSSDLDVGAANVVVKPGTASLDSLLNADSKVILVTDIMGMAGFRATSGDFSIPIEGQLFENGRRVRPLKDFLMSGNILELLRSVEAVGNDVLQPTGNIVSPSVMVRGLNIAGKA